jgi:hypothetical protein
MKIDQAWLIYHRNSTYPRSLINNVHCDSCCEDYKRSVLDGSLFISGFNERNAYSHVLNPYDMW